MEALYKFINFLAITRPNCAILTQNRHRQYKKNKTCVMKPTTTLSDMTRICEDGDSITLQFYGLRGLPSLKSVLKSIQKN